MEIPGSVDGWTLELIEKLVSQGYLETNLYDFKAELASRDPKYALKLTNTACAFANTNGGFIVFGIKDLGSQNRADRIVGISADSDLAKDFGDKIRGAIPNILFEFSNPPLKIKGSDKVVLVVEIPLSPNRPHANSKGTFYYRTNEGNKIMSYEQVRDSFLRYEERRTKMKLLLVELATLAGDAKAAVAPAPKYSLTLLDTTVINSILPDVYSMIQDDAEFVRDLVQIRRTVNVMNSKIRELTGIIAHPGAYGFGSLVEVHNREMEGLIGAMLPLIDRVVKKIESRHNLKRPF